jgi:uncharacterized protein
MNILKRLFDLQALDLEIKKGQTSLKDIERQLNENVELNKAKEGLKQISDEISQLKSKKKDIEFDVADLTKNSSQINSKLYGGSVKNPKELLGLEQELSDFKKKLGGKEDSLIELMSDEESKNEKLKGLNKKVKELELSWEKQKNVLIGEQTTIEKQIDDLNKQRNAVISDLDPESLKLYDRIFARKGCAIVRIEQGRCQGCRLALPMSDLQRTRGGKVVQCSSCGMILYSGQ